MMTDLIYAGIVGVVVGLLRPAEAVDLVQLPADRLRDRCAITSSAGCAVQRMRTTTQAPHASIEPPACPWQLLATPLLRLTGDVSQAAVPTAANQAIISS